MSTKDKVVIVTGGSSGIGEAIARRLADEGAKVMLTARREERLKEIVEDIKAKGGQAAYQTADVTRRDEVEAVARAAESEFGPVDVLVNNAGLMPLSMVHKLKVDEWERMIDVNIKGVLYGVAAVLPGMRERESGHIINLSSVAGHVVFPSSAVYCGTKYAVKAISEGLRQENAEKNIRVTNVSPGAIQSELTEHITDEDAKEAIGGVADLAIEADSIARAVAFAVGEPDDVSVNELIVRPTKQKL